MYTVYIYYLKLILHQIVYFTSCSYGFHIFNALTKYQNRGLKMLLVLEMLKCNTLWIVVCQSKYPHNRIFSKTHFKTFVIFKPNVFYFKFVSDIFPLWPSSFRTYQRSVKLKLIVKRCHIYKVCVPYNSCLMT